MFKPFTPSFRGKFHFKSKRKFFKQSYEAKIQFSSGIIAPGAKKPAVHKITTEFSGDDLNRYGVKEVIKKYAEKNGLPKTFSCHIYGLEGQKQ